MNLSQVNVKLEEEEPSDKVPQLRKEEARLLRIIEAVETIEASKEWGSLKTEVFDGLVTSLEKDLNYEAKKEIPDSLKLNRLAGRLEWASKYADLSKLGGTYRVQLQRIRLQLYGKTE